MVQHMVDVSGHNKAFVSDPDGAFRACKRANIDFCYVKTAEGRSYEFQQFPTLAMSAGCQGLSVGAYHFARPDVREGDAKLEAEHFLSSIKGIPLQLAPVLDIETAKDWKGEAKGLARWCLDWCQHVYEATGRMPVIYTGPGFWGSHLGRSTALMDMRLWVAAYPRLLPPSSHPPPTLGTWRPTAWQYTGEGKVLGVDGVVDLSYVYGDMS